MVRPRLALAAALALLALPVAACGDDDQADTTALHATSTSASPDDGIRVSTGPSAQAREELGGDAEGLDGRSLCKILPADAMRRLLAGEELDPGVLRARTNDSLDLSICRYSHGKASVRVIVDAGAQAGRRYFEQQAEMTQKFVRIPGWRPQLVRHVGDDHAWANAGAHWTPDFHMLVAQKGGYIVRVTFNVPAPGNVARREAAANVAREVFDRLGAKAKGR